MSSTEKSPADKPSKQACNNCRRRKIKCNRADPCDKCQRLLLACSYSDVLRRKGPRIRTLYPLAPSHPQSSRPAEIPISAHQAQPTGKDHPVTHNSSSNRNMQGRMSTPPSPAIAAPEPRYAMYDCKDQFSGLGPPELSSPDTTDSFHSDSSNYECFPIGRRLTPPVLLAHVNVYLKYLYPIMPIVNRKQLQLDSHHPEQLSPQRYAFMAAMCAATHIQLKLDGASAAPVSSQFQTTTDGQSVMSGEELLTEAVRARRDCDVVDGINIESLLTSFFFFAAYGNLDMQDHAWFYLCQSITMAITMGLHRESTYSDFNLEEAENRRRVFWLLFITER